MPFTKHKDYEKILEIVEKSKVNPIASMCNLTRTYRSTYEINEFAKSVIGLTGAYSQIDRHGDKVEVIHQKTFDPVQILEDSLSLKNSFNTVAIICKNIEETLLYKEKLVGSPYASSFRLVTKNDNVFVGEKIMIIPSYLSKGLEFDAAIVSNASSDQYTEDERNLFYVVLTRALHKLKIYYSGPITTLLSKDEYEKDR